MVMEKKKIEIRKDLLSEIKLDSGISGSIEANQIILRKGDIELKRKLNGMVNTQIVGDKVILEVKKSTKRNRKMFGTMEAHLKNMVKGLNKPFIYKLQAVSVHFPITVEIDKKTNELIIKNFLGERKDRRVKLKDGINIKVMKDIIEIDSADKELAGQVAASIEKGAKVRNRDRRIFQDGIYIIEKAGKSTI
jgi:large subunit ribosomal protein L6